MPTHIYGKFWKALSELHSDGLATVVLGKLAICLYSMGYCRAGIELAQWQHVQFDPCL
eukprot:c19453_g1_i1 orf=167-340(-)